MRCGTCRALLILLAWGAAVSPVTAESGDGAEQTAAPDEPWRAEAALDSPAWLTFGATQRTRYEYLHNQFRSGVPGDDMALSLRTHLQAGLRFDTFFGDVEVVDSRFYLTDGNTPLNTTLGNALEPLQAYVGVQRDDLLREGGHAELRAGRMTLDLGSRRLVARNRYRNTINAFNGIEATWESPRGDTLRAFVTLPVYRRPSESDALRDNAIRIDRESLDRLFWGLFARSRQLPAGLRLESYLFGLHVRSGRHTPTRPRQLVTHGARLRRAPEAGQLDFELEGALQLGTSEPSGPGPESRLLHLAGFTHVAVGYSVPRSDALRVALTYDYASGDADPNDDRSGRFDTLFGARRFEYGPTGLYGAVARANLSSPAVRLVSTPIAWLDTLFVYRAVWLAQARDAWTTANIRDASGASGRYVGQQIEARMRLHVLPDNVDLDLGFAHTWLGGMAVDAPNANSNGNPTVGYAQVTLEI